MNLLLASTSTVYGSSYLSYLAEELKELYAHAQTITFIPYARPSGITHDAYTERVQVFFQTIGKKVIGIHTATNVVSAIQNAEALFIGGGNTFLLVKSLHEHRLITAIQYAVRHRGIPYLGCSAGTNVAGINMQTTNDMPIVYPPSFDTLQLVPFNFNPHYIDPIVDSTHMGETRETRIKEFHTQNNIPVIGLREGSWIRITHNSGAILKGVHSARIFLPQQPPFEIPSNSMIENYI